LDFSENVDNRKGYSGLYQFGASYNPRTFVTATGQKRSGNYLLYWMASQAIWRVDSMGSKGLDARLPTTGAHPTSTATTPCLLQGCVSTSRYLCVFTIRCRSAMCRTISANNSFLAARLHGRRSTALNSTRCSLHYRCSLSNRSSSITPMWAGEGNAQSFSDLERRSSFRVTTVWIQRNT
jgi:hypothetical protein